MIDRDEELAEDPTYPTHYTISMFSKEGRSKRTTDASHVNEELRKLGLEWKQSDWAHKQDVVIVISPVSSAFREATQSEREEAWANSHFPVEAICPIHGRVVVHAAGGEAACSQSTKDHLPGSNGVLLVRTQRGNIEYVNGARPINDPPTTIEEIMQQARERITPAAKKVARTVTEYLLK